LEQGNREHHRASGRGAEWVGGDISSAGPGKGKRKRPSQHGADVGEAVSENGVNLDRHNISTTKVKRKKLQSAFGLFEPT